MHLPDRRRALRPVLGVLALILLAGIAAGGSGCRFPLTLLLLTAYPLLVAALSRAYLGSVKEGLRLVSRRAPALVLEGEEARVELVLQYRGALPLPHVLLRDGFPAARSLESPPLTVTGGQFDHTGKLRLAYRTACDRGYGDFELGPLEVELTDPLGLFTEALVLGERTRMHVRFDPPAPAGLELTKANALTPLGDTRSVRTGSSLEFFGLEEYAPGGDVRAICWSKMAQLGRPVLKTFEQDTRPDVLVVLNAEAARVKGLGSGNTLKRAVRLAVGMLRQCRAQGLSARLVAPMEEAPVSLTLPPTEGPHVVAAELLAKLEGARSVPLEGLLDVALTKASCSTIVLVVSHTLDVALDAVAPALFALKARHAQVSLWFIDDGDAIHFSQAQRADRMDKELFRLRMEELGISVHLLTAGQEPPAGPEPREEGAR